MSEIKVVRYKDLEPQWHVPGAREPGFMRWLKSWVGGPPGYVNPNKEKTIYNQNCVVGMMNLFKGQQQKGLHYHSITEIYVILKGELESYDGKGEKTYAGPLDCIYIPAGVPHGVRNSGDEDCELIWVHDGIEKIGTSVYYMDGIVTGPPQVEDISMVRFQDLQKSLDSQAANGGRATNANISWVGGISDQHINHNPGIAIPSDRVGIGMTVIKPGQSIPMSPITVGTCYLVMEGQATFSGTSESYEVTRLDGIWVPPRQVHKVSNSGEVELRLMSVYENAGALVEN